MFNGIVVHWRDSQEFIEIDFSRLNKHPEIRSTREIWGDGSLVDYRTSGGSIQKADDGFILTITYKENKNAAYAGKVPFGTSKISLKHPFIRGSAHWQAEPKFKDQGETEWTRPRSGLTEKKATVQKSVAQLERRQDEFRRLLKGFHRCCVITGESFPGVLDAAHIIPAHKGGCETIENGLLLRADIHRLYDAGAFRINPKGHVILHRDIDLGKYTKLLKGKRLNPSVLKHVSAALKNKLAQ